MTSRAAVDAVWRSGGRHVTGIFQAGPNESIMTLRRHGAFV